jgi:phosphoadenosine phosphosulfate reductase
MFSGGKDSLLCLLMLKPQLDNINVVFVNTGKNFPEVLEFVESIKPLCKKFIELKSDRDKDWSLYGMPSDLVASTYMNGIVNPYLTYKGGKMQTVQSCRYKNIMLPVINLIRALDSNLLIRGSKNTDSYHDGVQSLSIVEGVLIYNPIENFTDYQVMEALKTYDVKLPAHYSFKHTSLDCMDCTGFLADTKDRIELLKAKYPEVYIEVKANIETIIKISEDTLESIRKSIL